METRENDVKDAAFKLLRHKMLVKIGDAANSKYEYSPHLCVEDINEVLLVAGLPVIVADELQKKEVEVIA